MSLTGISVCVSLCVYTHVSVCICLFVSQWLGKISLRPLCSRGSTGHRLGEHSQECTACPESLSPLRLCLDQVRYLRLTKQALSVHGGKDSVKGPRFKTFFN